MIQKLNGKILTILVLSLAIAAGAVSIAAQTTAFTYQGRLTDGGAPANGNYDFRFQLYNTALNFPTGSPIFLEDVPVVNGTFSVNLDFSSSVEFRQTAISGLLIEIAVRPGTSTESYVALAPRQKITAAPFSIASLTAETAFSAINSQYAATSNVALNSNNLGGLAASNYVLTGDARLTDARNPLAGSVNYIQNTTVPQTANFNINGYGIINGDLTQTGTLAKFTNNNGLLVLGGNTGTIPISGGGTRMMFYPGKGAFRAGNVSGSQWDDANIGELSIALGSSTIASGFGSTAFGTGSIASGATSTAFGQLTTASGAGSIAIGNFASTNNQTGSFVYGDSSTTNIFAASAPNSFTMRTTGGFAAVGTFDTGAIPISGAGTRMMFYPKKAAFRAGISNGSQWDDVNIGKFSMALGSDTIASGEGSTALGTGSVAGGTSSTAIGQIAVASNSGATAIGNFVTASGITSTALGRFASTNNQTGSFVYGDASTLNTVNAETSNEFVVRAAGGFRFRTSGDLSTGCNLPAGSGVFQCTSSKTLKENFVALNGENILAKLRRVPVMQWNYIGEGKNIFHIGAFAEDFFREFGLGTDAKSIGLLDIAGVNTAAIQALDEKTRKQQQTIERQQQQIDALMKLVCASNPAAEVCR